MDRLVVMPSEQMATSIDERKNRSSAAETRIRENFLLEKSTNKKNF